MAKKGQKIPRYSNLYVKRRLVKLEIDVFAIIANGLIHHTPKQKILAQIKKEIQVLSVQIGLSDVEKNRIWLKSYSQYQEVSKKTIVSLRRIERKFGKKEDYEQSLVQRRGVIYDAIRAKIQNNDLVKEANEITFSYEYRMKHDNLYGDGGIIESGRENGSPFFLCSSHKNPAKDHKDWEGKMYYDENYEDYVTGSDLYSCRAYIRNHKLRSIQWVAGSPVFLTTRRNCKHYFMNIPLDQVLHSSAKTLLRRNGMVMKDEAPVSRNVLYYREYYNRLKVEEALNNLVPNEKLSKDINKDKKLLDKWKKTL